MSPTLQSIVVLIDQYGYLMLLLLAIVEGPIVCVLAGFLIAQDATLSVPLVYAILLVGDVCGDLFWYFVGYYGSKHTWAYRWMSVNAGSVEKLRERYRKNLGKTIMIAKYTQTGIIAMPAAGAARMPLGLFVLYNLLSSIPKTALLVMAGYFFGFALHGINLALRIGSIVLGIVTILLLVIYYQRYMRREHVLDIQD